MTDPVGDLVRKLGQLTGWGEDLTLRISYARGGSYDDCGDLISMGKWQYGVAVQDCGSDLESAAWAPTLPAALEKLTKQFVADVASRERTWRQRREAAERNLEDS